MTGGDGTTVLLAVADPVFRAGLAMLVDADPDLRLVGETETPGELDTALEQVAPQVVLLDLHLPELDVVEQVRRAAAVARVVLFARFARDDEIDAGLLAGAAGFVIRTATPDEILAALRAG